MAFATALANGIEPGKLNFKQDSCTGVGELRMFPATRQDVQATERSADFFAVAECLRCLLWWNALNADSGITLIV